MAKYEQSMRTGLLLMRMTEMDKTSLCTNSLIAVIFWVHSGSTWGEDGADDQ